MLLSINLHFLDLQWGFLQTGSKILGIHTDIHILRTLFNLLNGSFRNDNKQGGGGGRIIYIKFYFKRKRFVLSFAIFFYIKFVYYVNL